MAIKTAQMQAFGSGVVDHIRDDTDQLRALTTPVEVAVPDPTTPKVVDPPRNVERTPRSSRLSTPAILLITVAVITIFIIAGALIV